MSEKHCCLCGKKTSFLEVRIAFGMHGEDYAFCKKCLKTTSAYELFKRVTEISFGYPWPIEKLKKLF